MKKLALVGIGSLIAGMLTMIGINAATANATEALPISAYCTPVYETQPHPDYIAETWQHYSWTGGPSAQAPVFPDDNWQPNGKNHKDEAEGTYKQGGPASWFHWQRIPAVGDPTIEVQAGETCDLWVTWAAPGWYPDATNAETIGWPQTFVGFGQIAPEVCETTYQQDHYIGFRHVIEGILEDGVLTGPNPPEDHAVVKAWEMVSTDACPVLEPVPTPEPSPEPEPEPEPSPEPPTDRASSLADTGTGDATPWLALSALMCIGAGATALTVRKLRTATRD